MLFSAFITSSPTVVRVMRWLLCLQEEKTSLLAKLRQSASYSYPGQSQTRTQTGEAQSAESRAAARRDGVGQRSALDQDAASGPSGRVATAEAERDALTSRLQSNAGVFARFSA